MGAGVSTPSNNISSSSSNRSSRNSATLPLRNDPVTSTQIEQQVTSASPGVPPTMRTGSPLLTRPYTMSQRIVTSETAMLPNNAVALSNEIALSSNRNNRYTHGGSNSGGAATTPPNNGGDKQALTNTLVQMPESDLSAVGISNAPGVITNNQALYCLNPASDINSRLDTQVEVRVYPCNSQNGSSGKKKFTQFMVKPEGVIIQGTNRRSDYDLGSEYSRHIGRKLTRYELADSRACQLLVTTHAKSFYVVPAPEAFSRHSGTCRLLGDRKHPPTPHTLQVGDFLRVGSVGVVVIETHDGVKHKALSEEKIQKIMKDTASGGFIDLGETDGENSEASLETHVRPEGLSSGDKPVCYMCFDDQDDDDNPLISPCKCLGDTRYVHVDCLRKWHTAEADNQICFLSSVDATCSVCKSTFKSDFKLRNGKTVKLFKSSLEPPYISLLVATKHEMAQRLFNTRFQLSFSTLLKPDRRNSTRSLLLGRSSGSDMVLDYRTVSARHASLRFKNNEFVFCDAGSSNGSYLYLRRPVELTSNQSVQFRLGRSMISMRVVNKWNRRFLRAVRRTTQSSSNNCSSGSSSVVNSAASSLLPRSLSSNNQISSGADFYPDDHSIGSEEDVLILQNNDNNNNLDDGSKRRAIRTRESIMSNLPPPGQLHQTSTQHLELLYALAYPKRNTMDNGGAVAHKKVVGNQKEALLPLPSSNTNSIIASVALNEEQNEDEDSNIMDEVDFNHDDGNANFLQLGDENGTIHEEGDANLCTFIE